MNGQVRLGELFAGLNRDNVPRPPPSFLLKCFALFSSYFTSRWYVATIDEQERPFSFLSGKHFLFVWKCTLFHLF
jgi:hypothetical protein